MSSIRLSVGGLLLAVAAVALAGAGVVPAPATASPGIPGGLVFTSGTGPTGAVQTYTVPSGVTEVTILALGASGGSDASPPAGGPGAVEQGDFGVTPGEVLSMLPGGQPTGDGGGGGTFVWTGSGAASASNLLIAAGGGGGVGCAPGLSNGGWPGLAGESGGTGDGSTAGGSGGTGGAGNAAGGGGGLLDNGGDGGVTGSGGSAIDLQSGAGVGGAAGAGDPADAGGFGGGGGGTFGYGGGGGGYSGGGGGGNNGFSCGGGGGGGSYNAGANQSWGTGGWNGMGEVQIGLHQSITFTSSPGSATYGQTYTVTATGGGSGNPVVFQQDPDSTTCLLSGDTVTFEPAPGYTATGWCYIDAVQEGGNGYLQATARQAIFVNRAQQTVEFTSGGNNGTVEVGSSYYTPTAIAVPSAGPGSGLPVLFGVTSDSAGVCNYTGGGFVDFVGPGRCTIVGTVQGNDDYTGATATLTIYVVPVPPPPDGTTTTITPQVSATPQPGTAIALAVTVSDFTASPNWSYPGGTVSLSDGGAGGSFDDSGYDFNGGLQSCSPWTVPLAPISSTASQCQIIYTPPASDPTGAVITITASYGGDSHHEASVGTATVLPPAPAIAGFSPARAPVGATVTVSGTNLAGAWRVQVSGVSAQFNVVSPTELTFTVPAGAASGPISVTTAGGTASSAGTLQVKSWPPLVQGVSPLLGGVGATVTLTGRSFTGATRVTFNGTPAVYAVVSDTTITAQVPAGATTGAVWVTTAVGTGKSWEAFTVLPLAAPAPSIVGFSPAAGRRGTRVMIHGSGLLGATSVTFNGVAASFRVERDSTIVAVVPAGATSGHVAITTPGGTATSSQVFVI